MTVEVPLRVIIADDEPLARLRLRRLLAQFDGVDVVGDCANGGEAVDAFRRTPADVAFLDIQMPDLDGFAVLGSLQGAARPHIVFVTAHSEHAVRAFEARALDYLLKPVSADRLRQTLERVRLADANGEAPVAEATVGGPRFAERIAVPCGTRIVLVPVAQIDRVEAQANYIDLHVGARTLVLREPLAHFEARLDPAQFLRVHRSRIVRLDGVVEAEPQPSGRYALRLRDGSRVSTGRHYAGAVRAALGLRESK